MANIAFVTDSTAYLPESLVKKYNIIVLPQLLILGEHTYRDGVDITPREFYERLKTSKTMPTTAQVSIITMENTFRGLVKKGFDVMGVFISSKLSGTFQSAVQGRQALGIGAEKVMVVDSYSTSMAMGFQILAGVQGAETGADPSECRELIEKARAHTGVYFAVDTLEFIHRGGRIGGAQRFIGSALNLKPILALKEGRVEPEDRVRTKRKALDRLIDLVAERVKDKSNIHIATLHAIAEQEARELLERACIQFHPVESLISSVSPVVGTHAGPGTIGLAFMEGV